jgi:alginate O-acetyltransferase complex protein AlgI
LLAFSLQIYFDFSGYSDMAIGLGRMFGFRFAENFRYPYASRSLTDFWRRWHITLSSWMRDYVYIPLGGNRRLGLRNLFITFALCGLWHGAAWTFVIWGVWHGAMLAVERLTGRPLGRVGTCLAVAMGWVVFRAQSLSQTGEYLRALGGFGAGQVTAADYLNRAVVIALLAGLVACMPIAPWMRERIARPGRWEDVRTATAALVGFVGAILIVAAAGMTLAAGTYQPFLYFRF